MALQKENAGHVVKQVTLLQIAKRKIQATQIRVQAIQMQVTHGI